MERQWKKLKTAPLLGAFREQCLPFEYFPNTLNNKSAVLSIIKRQGSTTSENLLLFLPALCDSKTHTDRRLKRFSLSNCSATNNLVDKFFLRPGLICLIVQTSLNRSVKHIHLSWCSASTMNTHGIKPLRSWFLLFKIQESLLRLKRLAEPSTHWRDALN